MSNRSFSDVIGTYTLDSYNGKSNDEERITLKISQSDSGAGLVLHARVANTINGAAKYANGILTGSQIIATAMYGSPDQMKIEDALQQGLAAGFAVEVDAKKLTLRSKKDTFVYKRTLLH